MGKLKQKFRIFRKKLKKLKGRRLDKISIGIFFKEAKPPRIPVGRNLDVRPDDIFLVSYPKSGNTWMRFLLTSYLYDRHVTFKTINDYVPDIYNPAVTKEFIDQFKSPRIIKSHEPYDKRYPKVVYLVRDPRDVVISLYWWHKKMKFFKNDLFVHWNFQKYTDGFLCGAFPLINWDHHLNSWLSRLENDPDKFLLIKYEDMLDDIYREFKKVVSFLGFPWNEERAQRAISDSSFQEMRKREDVGDKKIPFARKGTKGQYKEDFSPEKIARYNRRFARYLKKFNYEP